MTEYVNNCREYQLSRKYFVSVGVLGVWGGPKQKVSMGPALLERQKLLPRKSD